MTKGESQKPTSPRALRNEPWLGQAVRAGRAWLGLSAMEFAAEIGMTGRTLQRIESGEPTTSPTLQRIVDAFRARGILIGPGGIGPLQRRPPPEAASRLLGALVEQLPQAGNEWPREERVAWLRAMAAAQALVFGPGDPPIDLSMDEATGRTWIDGGEIDEPPGDP